MSRLARVLAVLLCAGCTSHAVLLVGPAAGAPTNCFEACEALFGARPTLHCGPRAAELVCAYDRWPRAVPAAGVDDAGCRAECARAGASRVEACGAVPTLTGGTAVACQYEVAFH